MVVRRGLCNEAGCIGGYGSQIDFVSGKRRQRRYLEAPRQTTLHPALMSHADRNGEYAMRGHGSYEDNLHPGAKTRAHGRCSHNSGRRAEATHQMPRPRRLSPTTDAVPSIGTTCI